MGINCHLEYHTLEYISWKNMKARCYNKNRDDYYRYGGRGIKVCQRWLIFSYFYQDMGNKPSKEYTLERIDNDGNYEPGNCKWATVKEQSNNRSSNRKLKHKDLFK
jgi:hypothetical protein